MQLHTRRPSARMPRREYPVHLAQCQVMVLDCPAWHPPLQQGMPIPCKLHAHRPCTAAGHAGPQPTCTHSQSKPQARMLSKRLLHPAGVAFAIRPLLTDLRAPLLILSHRSGLLTQASWSSHRSQGACSEPSPTGGCRSPHACTSPVQAVRLIQALPNSGGGFARDVWGGCRCVAA